MRYDSSSPRVPLLEHRGDRVGLVTADAPQQVVGLGDELHVGVLDAVVDHLDEVAGAVGADVGDTRFAVDDRGDGSEDGAERLVGRFGATGHDRGAVEGALFAAGDSGADEVQSLRLQRRLAPDRVVEVGVAAVDDDVARLEQLGELVDDGVGARARLHHDDRGARLRQRRDEVLDRFRGDEPGVAVLAHQRVGALG